MVRKFMIAAVVSMVVVSAVPTLAGAAWLASNAVLGFGASYSGSDGGSRTHRGIDVAGNPGAPVESPVSGTVAFAGAVPGQDGGTVLAVSVDTAQGRVTIMPLEELETAVGRQLETGAVVGALARRGDPSSSEPHVHLSLRSGGLYLDPAVLLAAPGSSTAVEGVPCEVPCETAAKPDEGADAVASTAAEPSGVSAAGPAVVLAEGTSFVGDTPAVANPGEYSAPGVIADTGAAVLTQPRPQTVAAASAMGEGVALSPGPDSPISTQTHAVGQGALGGSGSTLGAAVRGAEAVAESATGHLNKAGLPVYLGLALALAASALVLSIRAFERRISVVSPVSDRLGRLLQQLRTGDTLHGLTSCPGESAFTVPGPSSPREVTK